MVLNLVSISTAMKRRRIHSNSETDHRQLKPEQHKTTRAIVFIKMFCHFETQFQDTHTLDRRIPIHFISPAN